MGYMHIDNLYKPSAQDILLFRECYALEKIHGTSAHIAWKDGGMRISSGGVKHESFVALFDIYALSEAFREIGNDAMTVFGEAYGGKCQGMSETYGKDLRFVAFEVLVGDSWLAVPQAESVAEQLGLEFVHYVRTSTDLPALDTERDADSVQAIRNGIGPGKRREGVVLRPLIEVRTNNGHRIIAKHKNPEFSERKSAPEVSPEKRKIMEDAEAVADEFVTPMRLSHVLDKMPQDVGMEATGDVIRAMMADVFREEGGEIKDTKEVRKAIGRRCAKLFKKRLQDRIGKDAGVSE